MDIDLPFFLMIQNNGNFYFEQSQAGQYVKYRFLFQLDVNKMLIQNVCELIVFKDECQHRWFCCFLFGDDKNFVPTFLTKCKMLLLLFII